MPWLALRLLGLRSAVGRAFAWATASATRMLAIALCVALLGGIWAYRGWSKEKAAHKADAAAWTAASAANQAAQIAQVKALEAKSASIAKDAENAHTLAIPVARNLSSAYADTHRCTVRQTSIGPASPASQGENPGVPAEMPASPDMVGITGADLQTVADLYVYALGAHNQAVDKINQGLAEPAK